MSGAFHYPNITSLPQMTDYSKTERAEKPKEGLGEFDKVLDQSFEKIQSTDSLSQVQSPIKFSAHASQRLKERRIQLDPSTMTHLREAIDKAESKGVQDSLVITKDAALIVNVKNRTVITAMDRSSLNGNIFTNIDGAVII